MKLDKDQFGRNWRSGHAPPRPVQRSGEEEVAARLDGERRGFAREVQSCGCGVREL